MVWMIIAIPLSAVFVGIFLLTMSIKSYDGLVVDDYYKQGKEINRVLTRNENARIYGLSADVSLGNDQQLVISLSSEDEYLLPDIAQIKFIHRTRAGLDQAVQVKKYADGLYRGHLPEQLNGLWRVQLETPEWRISGKIALPANNNFQLSYL